MRGAGLATIVLPIVLGPILLRGRMSIEGLALLLVPATWAYYHRQHGRLVPVTGVNPFIWFVLAAVAVSAWTTPSLEWSAPKIESVLLGALLFWATAEALRGRLPVAAAVPWLCVAGVAIALASLFGTRWEAKYEFMRPLVSLLPVRWAGLPGAGGGFNANPVGATMAFFLPLAIWPAVSEWRSDRPLAASLMTVAAGLFASVLVLSQSRSAWVACVTGVAVAVALTTRRAALTIGAFVGAFALLAGAWFMPEADSPSGLSMHGRTELWSRALMAIGDFPVTGLGMNVFRHALDVLYPVFSHPPGRDVAHSHNGVLQLALDTGLAGMTACVALWATLLTLLTRVARGGATVPVRAWGSGVLAGMVSQAVFQATDAIPLGAKVGALWWIAAGVAMCLHDGLGRVATPLAPSAIAASWLAISALAVTLALWSPLAGVLAGSAGGVGLGYLAARRA